MGPKKDKDKKGKPEKEKPAKTLKSEYLAKIAERNAVLVAAKKRIQKVEDIYFGTEKRYEQTQEDMTDVIKYLQKEIEENELEIEAYDEKITSYKNEINKNDKYYKAIISEMEADFEEKEKAMQYQVQQNAAKLSAFEEVRQLREEYLKKKEQIYRKMEEVQSRHQQEIYEEEKQSIIKQATMQMQMDGNLKKLAVDFREATDIAIGETTNKLIRENITLGNMFTCTQDIFERARESYRKTNEMEKQYKYNAELLDEQIQLVLQKYTKQVNEIDTLLRSQEELHEKIKMSEKLIKENRRLQRQIAEKECILKEKVRQLNDLMRVLNENKENFNAIKNTFNALRRIVVNLEMSLYEAASKVKYAIDIENVTRIIEGSIEDIPAEPDKEDKEAEEDLKEYKYKMRETAIEETMRKLSAGLLFDIEVPVPEGSDIYLTNRESTLSELNTLKMSKMNIRRY